VYRQTHIARQGALSLGPNQRDAHLIGPPQVRSIQNDLEDECYVGLHNRERPAIDSIDVAAENI
jgi:hypothetical protein